MGVLDIFCGKECRCKQRCKGWFGAQPDIERACKNACKTTNLWSKEEFLCSGEWMDEHIVFAAYGYDPCPGNETVIEDYFDPLGDREIDEAEFEKYKGLIIGGGVLIVAAVIGLIIMTRR